MEEPADVGVLEALPELVGEPPARWLVNVYIRRG